VIKDTGNAVLIDVRVIPRASRAGIAGTRNNTVLVRLAAAPVDGAANAELIELLAKALQVPKRAVSIVHGERGRLKQVKVEGLTTTAASSRLKLN
jgi:uncharacterized protein (TIGR00251 family)